MEEQSKIKNYNDVYTPQIDFEGEKIDGKEIIGKEIIIHDFAILNGQFGEFAVVDATIPGPDALDMTDISQGKRVQFLEGSHVIMGQLGKVKKDNNFPIKTKIEERTSEKSKLTYRTLS